MFSFLMFGIIQLLLRRGDTVNMMDLQQEHPDIHDNLARMQAKICSKNEHSKAAHLKCIQSTSRTNHKIAKA